MENKKNNRPAIKVQTLIDDKHPAPVTRRDFLSRGMIGLSAYCVLPTAIGMIARENQARADDCPSAGAAAGMLPFLVFDLAGGASLSGNCIPMDKGGNLLPSYSQLGMGDPSKFSQMSINTAFGAPMAGPGPLAAAAMGGGVAQTSKLLEGILSKTSAQAQACIRMGLLCHNSQSDSGANLHSATAQVSMAGYQGSLLRSGVGMQASSSGGNTGVPFADPTLKPLPMRSVNDLTGALSYGPGLTNLPDQALKALAKATMNLTLEQSNNLSRRNLGQQFATLLKCGFSRNIDFTAPVQGIDPRLEPVFQKNYGLNPGSDPNNSVTAAIVMNVLKGNTGPGTIQMGGYDYHDNTQTSGDGADFRAGQEIGTALQAAFDMGQPLVFQVLTDGAISSQDGNRNWAGDSNEKGATIVGMIRPQGAPSMRRTQIGSFTAGQGADSTSIVGSDTKMVSFAVFANYLAMCGQTAVFDRVVQISGLSSASLDQVLMFG